MALITREPPDQRRHFRSARPMEVRINYFQYPIRDWSLSGLCVEDVDTSRFAVGDQLVVQVRVDSPDLRTAFGAAVEIVWVDYEHRRFAARFQDLGPQEREILTQYFAEPRHNGHTNGHTNGYANGHTNGHTGLVAGPVPAEPKVTPVSEKPTDREAPAIPRGRLAARRLAYSTLYLVLGLVLILLVGSTLYFHFFRLDLDYCVIAKPLVVITSQDVGRCQDVFVREGDRVSAGQPLLRMEDDVLTQEVQTAELLEAGVRVELQTAEERVAQEEERVRLYKNITQDRVAAARALVTSLEDQLKSNQAQLRREQDMVAKRLTTLDSLNQIQTRVSALEGELLQARAQLRIADHSLTALDAGEFYNTRNFVGDLRQYRVTADDAAKRLKVASDRVRLARERVKRLAYTAPFDARVVRVGKPAGAPANRGEMLVVLERAGEELVIEGFATQDEVNQLAVGARATAYVPALDRTFEARVTKIDRTSGFLTDMQVKLRDSQLTYNYRGSQDKSAYLQLAIINPLTEADHAALSGGLPVSVSVPRRPAVWQRIRPVADEVRSATAVAEAR